MNKWFLLRVALIVALGIVTLFAPLEPKANPPMDWDELLAILLFSPIALVIVIGFQVVNPWSAKFWRYPSWRINPFSFGEPLQFFHFASYFLLAQGSVIAVRTAGSQTQFDAEALVLLAMAGGCFIGVQLALLAFRSKLHRDA